MQLSKSRSVSWTAKALWARFRVNSMSSAASRTWPCESRGQELASCLEQYGGDGVGGAAATLWFINHCQCLRGPGVRHFWSSG